MSNNGNVLPYLLNVNKQLEMLHLAWILQEASLHSHGGEALSLGNMQIEA